jgi:predicted nucleotidyltransferase component of viral defense system
MIDLTLIRTEIIAAVAGDPWLREELVLKGGNALALVHGVGMRASVDIDYSMSDDLRDPERFGMTLYDALCDRFDHHDLVVFDFAFERRPRRAQGHRTWGGYTAVFKLVDRSATSNDLDGMRRRALTVESDPQASRTFRIEISKYEYCDDQIEVAIGDNVVCRVYSLDLVAAEKLRALCQQMPEYGRRRHPTPRSRDFYDIHALITEASVDLGHPDFHALVRATFGQKEVPLRLIADLRSQVEFHEQDWPQVLNAIPAHKPREFGFYTDFVAAEARKLQILWDVDTP